MSLKVHVSSFCNAGMFLGVSQPQMVSLEEGIRGSLVNKMRVIFSGG